MGALCWSGPVDRAVWAHRSWGESLVAAVTCRSARAARLRPPRQARSPRPAPRPAGRRGRAAVRPEVRRCGRWVLPAGPGRSWRSPPTGARDPRRAVAARGTSGRGEVAPKRLVHSLLVGPGTTTVGPAYVLVVDEELVEAREPAHPSDAEEAWRRSRPERRDEPGEVPQRERSSSRSAKRAHAPGRTSPGPARESCSRRTRCAARSWVVHGARRVGASGPSSSSRSLSRARSTASKSGSAISPECSQAGGGHGGSLRTSACGIDDLLFVITGAPRPGTRAWTAGPTGSCAAGAFSRTTGSSSCSIAVGAT